MYYEETPYGFKYGGINISRCMSDDIDGWGAIELDTEKNNLILYVTKTGKIQVIDQITGEVWVPTNSVVKKRKKPWRQNGED